MDWHEKMNAAMDYIEDNLTGSFDIGEAARLAHCSEYHFRRMFSFVAGVSVSEYIRRRRLTIAVQELQKSKNTIEEIARTYGYSSPDAFTRAFQSVHGINPSQVKENQHSLKSWPRMTFYLTIKGGTEMDYRIEEKPSFRIAGIKKSVPLQFEGVNPEIEAMWKNLDEQKIRELKQLSNIHPSDIIQASANFDEGRMEEKGKLDHYIGVATTKEIPEKWERLEVQAASRPIYSRTHKGLSPSRLLAYIYVSQRHPCRIHTRRYVLRLKSRFKSHILHYKINKSLESFFIYKIRPTGSS